MEFLRFLNKICNGGNLGKYSENFCSAPRSENNWPQWNFVFLFFPAQFFEFGFNPRGQIKWSPGHLGRVCWSHLANEKVKPWESLIKSHLLLRNHTSSLNDFSGLVNEDNNRANIYLFKVNNRNTTKRFKICSKSTVKIPEWRQWALWCFYY